MSSCQELHNRLDEKLRALVSVRKPETGDELDLGHCGHLGRQTQIAEERDRSYEHEDLYSVPIGSRYHPERAPIWEIASPVETTETRMGPR